MSKSNTPPISVNENLEVAVLDILANSQEAMSIQQIQRESIILSHHTSQKMTHILAKLIEMGLVRKGKSKSTGRMMYKAVSVMLAQGYSMTDDALGNPAPIVAPTLKNAEFFKNYNINWELKAEEEDEG